MKNNSSSKLAEWEKEISQIRIDVHQSYQSIQKLLDEIEGNMVSGKLSLNENVIDIIWNRLGLFFFNRGNFADSERVFKRMLDIMEKTGTMKAQKGLALYNLGISQINSRNFDEGIPNVLQAYEEDVRLVGEREAKERLANKLKANFLAFVCNYIDSKFLANLKAVVSSSSICKYQSLDLISVLDESEKLFLAKIMTSKARIPFGTDAYTKNVIFDNLKNICLLTELVLKKKYQGTLGGIIPKAFPSEPWTVIYSKHRNNLTRFDSDPNVPEIKRFENNLSQIMTNTFDTSKETDYLVRLFLLTVLIRNYTSHFYDDYPKIFVEQSLYNYLFKCSMQALLYCLNGIR